jgi:hypothetical protein
MIKNETTKIKANALICVTIAILVDLTFLTVSVCSPIHSDIFFYIGLILTCSVLSLSLIWIYDSSDKAKEKIKKLNKIGEISDDNFEEVLSDLKLIPKA